MLRASKSICSRSSSLFDPSVARFALLCDLLPTNLISGFHLEMESILLDPHLHFHSVHPDYILGDRQYRFLALRIESARIVFTSSNDDVVLEVQV